ncbi:MAG: nucleoside-diphosphate kinase [Nanoarchaeota archaeon]|nr:nucleoside-diphosphate kinase [Nanoarchaeota archaeon]
MVIEQTLVLIKPDGLKRGLVGEIITRIERTGLKIIAMKMIWPDKKFAEQHYFDVEERHGKKVLDNLTGYLTAGPVLAICFEGVDAISLVRKIAGPTYPNEAPPGTIRGDFCHISKIHANENNQVVGNLIHASAGIEDAKKELSLWFTKKEMHSYKRTDEEHVW